MFEDNDNTQSFPSVQSGSWSALMQSALEETSSTDTGVQEEWSGLSFQNPELSNDNNQPSNLIENGKNPSLWQNNIFQSTPSLSSRPLQMHQGLSGEFEKGFLPDNQRQSASDVTTFNSISANVDRSADLNSQTSRHMLELLHKVNTFKEYKHGTQSAYTDLPPVNETPKTETTDAFTPSSNSSTPQYFGLRLGPQSQRPPINYFDLSQFSQQVGEDGQRSSLFEANSTRQSNTWVQQNLSGMGLQKAPSGSPSTSDVANSRIETASEAPKEPDNQMCAKGANELLEAASGHVLNSQGFDYTKGQEGKIHFEEESFSGRAMKNEKVDSGIKAPLLMSMSQLSSVYENYKTMLGPSSRESQLGKHVSHPLLQDGSQLHRNSSFAQMNLTSTSQYGSVWPVTGTSSLAVNQDLLLSQSKKRKFPTYELLPWHKEATKGSSRPHNTSIAELEWAQAAKRVPEKKRIILTTQLMQVLFRPAPAAILSDDASTCYNTISYFAARLALGDACSLANHSHTPSDTSHSLSEKGTISKGSGDQNLSKIVENFIDRAKKLEDELLRVENGGSVVEIRMESQDLERFSVINRFAKFHTRPQMVAPDPSSSGAPKLHPQRYVTASPMPKIVPQGHNCLPL
ncbi:uncharacterized protein LOC143595672 [Bidens hawaiensis]|uniref:uncharacterized protein LOC143595672 n=1 Tax=Bidens hawaiensis TaxID=980011 RepID=UPI00404A5866